jgi:hypothetical protein
MDSPVVYKVRGMRVSGLIAGVEGEIADAVSSEEDADRAREVVRGMLEDRRAPAGRPVGPILIPGKLLRARIIG